MKAITYINVHKVLVVPLVLGLMWFYDNWTVEAFIYLSLHGTYCLLWLLKGLTYPDQRFQSSLPARIGIIFIFLPLAAYYVAPYLLISRRVLLPPYLVGIILCIFTVGMFLHYVGDAQKYYTLKLQKGLIEEGLYSRTRNPNYLGEILIYTSFALASLHWLPIAIVVALTLLFFVNSMTRKDRSLSRHPGFEAYRKRSGLLFPKLF
jgi:protein-S-isoprenylcysteine O-methyltransferase Ste14